MVILVWKEMRTCQYVQARRVECALCGDPFNYIHTGTTMSVSCGIPVFSLDESLMYDALSRAAGQLDGLVDADFVGEATCPNCGMYQPWMVSPPNPRRARNGMIIGAVAAFALTIAIALLFNVKRYGGVIWTGLTLILMLIGGKIGSRPRTPPLFSEGEDRRSLSDEKLDAWIADCDEEEIDPVLEWSNRIGLSQPEDPFLCSLGLQDRTGETRHPQHETSLKLRQLKEHGLSAMVARAMALQP